MTTLARAMSIKLGPIHYDYSYTPVLLDADRATFPYPSSWRGNYRCAFPIIESRRAGFRPRVDVVGGCASSDDFRLPDGCFETAPSTQFPCWEAGYGCKRPHCRFSCDPKPNCATRFGSR